ncbi:M48 family metallopeptidase [Candidatus Woesearchaeota archaeon]|nr:M48 family metallopeptidase [Candidatus Woesearchaeota archaeon]
MKFIYEAANRLKIQEKYNFLVKYSGRVKGFRAFVKKKDINLSFTLSKKWHDVSEEIKIGLVQELLEKILHLEKIKTMNKDLYYSFLKNAHLAIPKTKTNPLLETLFEKLNQQYFDSLLEKPNFGISASSRTLGCYEYGTDTITITKHLFQHPELLEYVLYHEMLHKKHKFSSSKERSRHHSKAFRDDEKKFQNAEYYEKELEQAARSFPKKNYSNLFKSNHFS